jgi:hypothetical protein
MHAKYTYRPKNTTLTIVHRFAIGRRRRIIPLYIKQKLTTASKP